MAELQLESLLAPISADAPCGPVYAAEPPDWPVVHEQATQLAARTRDLRVAVWLARSGARVRGLVGAVDGLRLVQGLVERHWEHLGEADETRVAHE